MSSLMEDDYAPATRSLWPSILATVLIIGLLAFLAYRRRTARPDDPLHQIWSSVNEVLGSLRGR